MITNTNGIAESIYHYIWLKDDSLIKESFQLRLPDTIIFKNGMPQVWYFTNQQGEILMKKNDCRKPENIINYFSNTMLRIQSMILMRFKNLNNLMQMRKSAFII
ncbi:unnamed protein product [Paramecium octaurelia]|uniref:Uncharacterized protein n=1 Tax=Paramecium octaurelia TaxID=43137 RepID=A0A8S1ST52_PAROT|nr:unnamed protein product [Paramecium octaurelia]